jgi:SAM-dependent methyltransferase
MAPPPPPSDPYYREDLALVHHRGFAGHAATCAPGILALLEPIRERDGLVVEIGCGSGLLTRSLVAAGHRVVATDASPAMLRLAAAEVPGVELAQVTLPDDPVPEADAVVGVGHALNYVDDLDDVHRALDRLARAVRPGGILALDLCDLEWGRHRTGQGSVGWVGDDWAIVTRFSVPAPDRYVREMTTFVRDGDGSWRRDDERHDNVLVDLSTVPGLLAAHGLQAEVRDGFGDEELPVGLRVVVARRPPGS